jgi:TonB family protein
MEVFTARIPENHQPEQETLMEDFMNPNVAGRFLSVFTLGVCLVAMQARGAEDIELAKEPKPVKQANVKYPEDAMKQGIQGTVYVGIFVDKKGSVAEARVEKSDAEMLNKAALEAARQWTFTPAIAKRDGQPVGVWLTIPFRFKLQEDGKEKESKK